MNARTARWLAWMLWAVSLVMGIASVPLVIANRDAPIQSYYGTAWLEVLFRLAGEVDLGAIGMELGNAVGATMRPSHVSLWLRDGTVSEPRNDSRTARG